MNGVEQKKKSIYETLCAVDVTKYVKKKNNLTYLPWAAAWGIVKSIYPQSTYRIISQVVDDFGNRRYWHDDGKTGWVEVETRIVSEGTTSIQSCILPIMDYRNQAIPIDKITSTDANKSAMRCLVKSLAMHGLGLYVYNGEDIPESTAELNEVLAKVDKAVKAKAAISDEAKLKVKELCEDAEKLAYPEREENEITGAYRTIDDIDILESLHRKLLKIR